MFDLEKMKTPIPASSMIESCTHSDYVCRLS